MAVDIILKKGRGVPPADSLSLGELAVDDATGIVYTLLVSGEVVPVNQAAIDSKAVLDISDSAPLGVEDGYLWLNSLNGLVYIYDRDAGWFEFPNSGSSTGGGDGIPEAPMEGGPYGRQTGGWVEITGGDGNVDLTGYATEEWVTEQGYLTDFTESDPTVPDHVKGITEEDIATWNAGGSGVAGVTTFNNRSGNVVLTTEDVEAVYSYTESDPTVPDHVKSITEQDIANWNAGTGGGSSLWTEESDGSISRQGFVRVNSEFAHSYTEFKNGFGIEQRTAAGAESGSAYRVFVGGSPTLSITNGGDYSAPNGNIAVNKVNSGSFVKNGGTASQLLCADGSVVEKDSLGGGGGGDSYWLKSDILSPTLEKIGANYSLDAFTSARVFYASIENETVQLTVDKATVTGTVQAADYLDANGDSIIRDPVTRDERITDEQISNWNTAYSWNDHSTVGYLTSVDLNGYATQVWVQNQNYLTSYSETDPTVPQHVKNITQTDINNWNAGSSVDLTGYATESWVSSNYQLKGSYLTSSDLNGYATTSWVTSQGYATQTWVNQQGFSKTDTKYSAGNGLSLTGTTFTMSGSYTGSFTATGDITAYSDEKLKDNIVTAPLGILDSLRGVEFTWKEDGRIGSGVVAQEVEKVLPHLIHDHEDGHKSVNYNGLVAYLIEEVKSLKSELETLRGDS